MKTGRFAKLIKEAQAKPVLVEGADPFEQIEADAARKHIIDSFGGADKMVAALDAEKATARSYVTVEDFMSDLDAYCAEQVSKKA